MTGEQRTDTDRLDWLAENPPFDALGHGRDIHEEACEVLHRQGLDYWTPAQEIAAYHIAFRSVVDAAMNAALRPSTAAGDR